MAKKKLTKYINKQCLSSNLHFPEVLTLYYAIFPDKRRTKNNTFWIDFLVLDKGFTVLFNWGKLLCKVSARYGWFWVFLGTLLGSAWSWIVVGGFDLFWVAVDGFGWFWVVTYCFFWYCAVVCGFRWFCFMMGGFGWFWVFLMSFGWLRLL